MPKKKKKSQWRGKAIEPISNETIQFCLFLIALKSPELREFFLEFGAIAMVIKETIEKLK